MTKIHEGDRALMGSIEWTKACACTAGATTGRIVMREANEAGRVTFTHHPGPVCDLCDKPWLLKPRRPPAGKAWKGR